MGYQGVTPASFKNSLSAITTSTNTPLAIVSRDANGNFSAGTVTASLSGNASTVTTNANLTGHITSVGNAAVLGSFTSAQLSTALTDETGSGALVFATSPTLVTPVLGVATATSLSTGSSGVGINIGTSLISGPATITIDPAAVGDNTGTVEIKGNLTVQGTTTTVNSTTTTVNQISLGDDDKALFGDGNDLQIYHLSSSTSNIINSTTGDLYLKGEDIYLQTNDNEAAAYFLKNGAVELYYDNAKKFETTTTGAKVTGALEVTQEYPTIRPTLDLNFAATKTLDRRITFTRDSLGTFTDDMGIVRYASNNVPRFDHDPDTGESLGLLIEESRTNLLTNSNTFNSQTVTNVTISADTTDTLSPDGTYNAAKITDNSTNGDHRFLRTYTVVSGSIYTSSIFIKKGTQRYVSILAPTATGTKLWATYDLQNGVITGSHTSTTATITSYPNDWYRCTIKTNAGASASAYLEVSFNSTSTNPSWPTTTKPAEYSGSGDYFYVWGMQGELGSFPTSYIPTGGSAVTRAKDQVKITGTNFTDFYGVNDHSFLLDFNLNNTTSTDSMAILSVPNATYPWLLYRYTDNHWKSYNGSDSIVNVSSTYSQTNNKFAFGFDSSNGSCAYNGSLTTTNNTNLKTGSYLNASTMIIFAREDNSSFSPSGHLKQLKYYNKRLPNAQLQGLTQQ